ncbi:MAG: hypothetical protein F4Z32_05285 [Gemmatimonadetes bacterium]|nr:hypothetical protein [Gemmatimonadota bacterium]
MLARSKLTAIITLSVALGSLAYVLLLSDGRAAEDLLGVHIVILAIALNVILVSGVIVPDMNGGAAALWLQRPVKAVPYYLTQWLMAFTVATAVTCVIVLLGTLADTHFIGTHAMSQELSRLPAVLLVGFVAAAICFAVSAWVPKGSALVAIAVLLVGGAIDDELAIRSDIMEPILSAILRAVVYPQNPLADISDFTVGEGAFPWLGMVRIVLYTGACMAVGCLGIHRLTTRKGLVY